MLNFKKLDFAALLLSISVITVFSVYVYSGNSKAASVRIEAGGRVWIYPLDEDRELSIEGPIGITLILITDNTAYIKDSPCPDKLCILAGKLDKTGQWAACLPNRVFVSIEGSENEDIDDLNY